MTSTPTSRFSTFIQKLKTVEQRRFARVSTRQRQMQTKLDQSVQKLDTLAKDHLAEHISQTLKDAHTRLDDLQELFETPNVPENEDSS